MKITRVKALAFSALGICGVQYLFTKDGGLVFTIALEVIVLILPIALFRDWRTHRQNRLLDGRLEVRGQTLHIPRQ